jgi:hypothetical protein
MQFVDLAQDLHRLNPLVQQAKRAADGKADGDEPAVDAEAIDAQLSYLKQFAAILRVIRRN